MKPTTHLVIPDSHVVPGTDMSHFEALGNLIVDRQPDKIIDLGDRADFSMLVNLRTINHSEERYQLFTDHILSEAEAVNESIEVQFKALNQYNFNRIRAKRRKYTPETHYLMGNHCKRGSKLIADAPNRWLKKRNISVPDDFDEDMRIKRALMDFDEVTGFSKYDYVHEYLHSMLLDGIHYSHAFVNCGSKLRTAVDISSHTMTPTVSGDTHSYELVLKNAPMTGRPIHSLIAGVFFDPEDPPGYYDPQNTHSPSGVTLLHVTDNQGSFDPEFISFKRLMRDWS